MTELTTFAAGAGDEASAPELSESTTGVLHAAVEIGPALGDGAA